MKRRTRNIIALCLCVAIAAGVIAGSVINQMRHINVENIAYIQWSQQTPIPGFDSRTFRVSDADSRQEFVQLFNSYNFEVGKQYAPFRCEHGTTTYATVQFTDGNINTFTTASCGSQGKMRAFDVDLGALIAYWKDNDVVDGTKRLSVIDVQ